MCFGGGGGTTTNTTTTNPIWYGSFGETSNGTGLAVRNGLYPQVTSAQALAQANNTNLTGQIQSAAQNPGWQTVQNLAQGQLQGDYLSGSAPLSDQIQSIQARAERDASNQASGIRDGMERAGIGFSTANQQAQQANSTAQRSAAMDMAAGVMSNNYARERGYQQSSPGMLDTSVSQPINYLGQLSGAYFDPLNKATDSTMKLAGVSMLGTPNVTVTQKPGALDYATGILGAL